ncbi:MAG: helix-turn-helix domain-containing protein [bacterium]|nr:helix-turn-helix domain-containing protein [bacterium]
MAETTQHPSTSKTVLTTGQVARICHVATRTVTKWFDTGKLPGYRIPGSRDRRIPLDGLIVFMKDNDMPTGTLDGTLRKVLLFDPEVSAAVPDELSMLENYEVRTAINCFEAGMLARDFVPNTIVISLSNGVTACKAIEINRSIKDHDLLKNTKLFAVSSNLTPKKRQKLLSNGFDRCLDAPYTAIDLAEMIEDTMTFVT